MEKIKFRETALICKILKCERISGEGEVNFLSSTRLDRFVLLLWVLAHAKIINDIITHSTFWLNICPLTKVILTESATNLGKMAIKYKGHVDFEVFFTQEAIGQSDDKIYGVTENVIYCYK